MPYDLTIPLSLIEKTIMENIKRCIQEGSDFTLEKIENDDIQLNFPSEQSWLAFASTALEDMFYSLHDLRYQLNPKLALPETL